MKMKACSYRFILALSLLHLSLVSPSHSQTISGGVTAEQDPRLSRTVSISLKSANVGQFLRSISALTAVNIRAESRNAENRGIRASLREAPLAVVLNQTALLFDWGIKRNVLDGEIVYRFILTGPADRGNPRAVQRILSTAVRSEAEKSLEEIKPIIDAWTKALGDFENLKNQNPDIARELENDPEMLFRVARLSSLSELERRQWIEERILTLLDEQGPQAKFELVKSQIASEPPSQIPNIENEPTVSLKIEEKTPFWSAIEMLSKQTGINFLSDRYSRPIYVSKANFEKANLTDILNSFCRDALYEWKISGNFIRLKSKLWFYEELREPPLPVIERWLKVKSTRGQLSFSDLAGLAASLTHDQIAGLADQEVPADKPNLVWEGRNILKSLHEFRLYNMLNGEQKRAAEGRLGLAFLQMNPAQRDGFLRYAPPGDFPPEQAAESALFISFTENSAIFRYDFGLGVSRTKEVMIAVPREDSIEVKESNSAIGSPDTALPFDKRSESQMKDKTEKESEQ